MSEVRESSIKQAREEVGKDPQDPIKHYHLGFILATAGETEEAVVEYENALGLDPGRQYSTFCHYGLGLISHKAGDLENAIEEFGWAVEDLVSFRCSEDIRPKVAARAHYALGCALFEKTQQKRKYGREEEDLAEAERNLAMALESDPTAQFHDLESSPEIARERLGTIRTMIQKGWFVEDDNGDIIKFYAGKEEDQSD